MSIYQHFRPEEKEFIDQVSGMIEQVKGTYAPKLTGFLDPREQFILSSIVGKDSEVVLAFFGGSDGVERKRAFLYPDYYSPEETDYQIALYEIRYPKKFLTLEHRQILGTLMSLGIKREKFGDILITSEHVQFIAAKEIDSYLAVNLEKIGNSSVTIEQIPLTSILVPKEQWQEEIHTVSSLRLDAVLSTGLKQSRQKVQTLIKSGKVKVNFKVTENVSAECRESDVLSVRGFGRVKIISIDGKTKKDKYRLTLGIKK